MSARKVRQAASRQQPVPGHCGGGRAQQQDGACGRRPCDAGACEVAWVGDVEPVSPTDVIALTESRVTRLRLKLSGAGEECSGKGDDTAAAVETTVETTELELELELATEMELEMFEIETEVEMEMEHELQSETKLLQVKLSALHSDGVGRNWRCR